MKELILEIQENNYPFFMELLKNFDFVKVKNQNEIPEEHKKIVRERIKNHDKDRSLLVDWDSVKDTL